MCYCFLVWAQIAYSAEQCSSNVVIKKEGIVDYVAPSRYQHCYELKNLIIDEGIVLIGNNAFEDCSQLQTVSFPGSLRSIKYGAFSNCPSLRSITVPEGVEVIEENAFRRCIGLQSISLPSTLTHIGLVSFQESMDQLSNIEFPNGNSVFHTSNLLVYTNTTLLFGSNYLSHVLWPTDYALTTIHHYSLAFCSKITEITLPDSILNISTNGLSFLENLKTITIGDKVEAVDSHFIEICFKLENIYVSPTNNYYSSNNGVFYNKDFSEIIYYPPGKADDYFIVPLGTSSIGINSFSYCSRLKGFLVDKSHSTFSVVDGFLFSKDKSKIVRVAPSVTTFDLVEITQRNGVNLISIESGAFYSSSLQAVEIPESVESIGTFAFAYSNIKNVEIPQKVNYIGINFFYSSQLENIIIKAPIKELPENAFVMAPLKTVVLPETIKIIGGSAFRLCFNLATINIPKNLEKIGPNGFYFCSELGSIELPESLKEIGVSAFESCIKLKQVTIPASIAYVPDFAFSTCTGVSLVTFKSCNTLYSKNAFYSIPNFSKPVCIASKTFTNNLRPLSFHGNLFKFAALFLIF